MFELSFALISIVYVQLIHRRGNSNCRGVRVDLKGFSLRELDRFFRLVAVLVGYCSA